MNTGYEQTFSFAFIAVEIQMCGSCCPLDDDDGHGRTKCREAKSIAWYAFGGSG